MATTLIGRALLAFGAAYALLVLGLLWAIALPERCAPPAPCFKPALDGGMIGARATGMAGHLSIRCQGPKPLPNLDK